MKTRTRAILATIVASLLLIAAIAAGLNAVFTVTHIRAEFSTCSDEGEKDAKQLRSELDAFVGKSTTFLELDEVRAVIENYPHFRILEVEKEYPSGVHVSVSERRETFAFKSGEEYVVLDEEGGYLGRKDTPVSRVGGDCILLEAITSGEEAAWLSVDGDAVSGIYFKELFEIVDAFAEKLEEFRANVNSFTLRNLEVSEARLHSFRIRMHEGVVIDIANPAYQPAEKAKAAIGKYLALGDEERTFGFITVGDMRETGELYGPYYSRNAQLG